MSTDSHVARCLGAIGDVSNALADDLRGLSAEAWNGPTNCAPWRVRDLAVHVVASGEGFIANIRQGLAGVVKPGVSDTERQRRQLELEAADPETFYRALRAVTVDFVSLYAGLHDQQLDAICFHRRGNRAVRWYAAHRLAEVAFHAWDLHLSLGREPVLDEQVAALLLPTLLESNAPRTYAAGLTPQRGRGERYLLAVDDDAEARWLVTIDPDKLEARRGGYPADLTLSGSAAALALVVYGRWDVRTLRLDGPGELADRFALIFPRP